MVSKTIVEDDVVISGMSGRFPECDTVEEFQQKLFSGVDLVKENTSRWPKDYLDTYSGMGFMKDLGNFDAPFFGAHPKLAERTDPIVRTLLETSFEAILDAGLCPTALRGTETGVVVVVSSNEAADWWSADPDRVNGYEFLGCTRTMYSNRISFSMDLRGPSYTMDSQSSSGLLAIQQAYHMLKCGMVDAVIVAGVNLVLNPHFNIMFKKLNMLSPDGKCRVFDADAQGYGRSEAAVAVLMQRASDARRIYGYVAAVNANCDGYKPDGCNAVSASSQMQLYRDTYASFHLDPLRVSFVEAHGYSTVQGDKEELNGIASVFCDGDGGDGDNEDGGKDGQVRRRQRQRRRRREPLLIGSVKSNVGCGEPVGGLVSLIKILLAMEHGILPANLHFKTPNPNVPALKDGRLKVVDKLTVWNGEYAAINSFGIGGTNAHLVVKRNPKEKSFDDTTATATTAAEATVHQLPRIVAVSGRTEQAVRALLDDIGNVYSDNEFCALINNVFSQHIQHYNYRAFSIFGGGGGGGSGDSDSESQLHRHTVTEVSTYIGQEERRPICFVFSGMGSQWAGMCRDLLQMQLFRETIDKCDRVLKRVDFDLYAMLARNDRHVYSNVLNSFVGITCTQIALVDILRKLNVQPDFIIGHSIGELGCAYADDTLSLEQTVLATYWRGKSLLTSQIPVGAMASIGLSYEEVRGRLPADVTVACHNSVDNVTVSGPAHSVDSFVSKLQSEGIFARPVNSSGYAFHSQYIAEAGAIFKAQLEKIISGDPKRRSKRWISTSVADSMWNTPSAQYSCVQYHLNNLLSPVFFSKALTYVPDNAVVIEIAPHALLQSILKASLNSKCTHVGLLRRNQSTVYDLLSNFGRLYNAGLQPKFENLYPPVSFPVSRKTPMIQSMIKWDHSTKWFLVSFLNKPACGHGEIEADVDVSTSKYKFLTRCVYDDSATFPVAAYLCLIWEAVAKLKYSRPYDVALVIENFQLIRKRCLSKQKPLKFVVNLLERSGECEIRENDQVVARAIVRIPANVDQEFSATATATVTSAIRSNGGGGETYLPLKPNDIYRDLHAKGYSYGAEFKQILYVDNKIENGKIAWSDNWITYLEAMLQLHLLSIEEQRHYAIDHIRRIVLDPSKHRQQVERANNVVETGVPVKFSAAAANVITSAGVEIDGVNSTLVSATKKQLEPIILHSEFVPHFSNKMFTPSEAISICAQLVFENINNSQDKADRANVAEIICSSNPCASVDILETSKMQPYISAEITLYDTEQVAASATKVAEAKNVTVVPVCEQHTSLAQTLRDSAARKRYHLMVASAAAARVSGQDRSYLDSELFRALLDAVDDEDGFLLMLEQTQTQTQTQAGSGGKGANESDLNDARCKLIAKFQTSIGTYVLIRKTPKWKTSMEIVVRNDAYSWMDGVKMALRKYQIDKRTTLLVYQGDDASGLIGFVKSIRREPFGRGLRCLFTDDSIYPYKIVDLAYIDQLRKGLVFNVYRDGEWGSYSNFKLDKSATTVQCEHAFFGVREIGNFSSLAYIEAPIPHIDSSNLPPNHELCYVYYASIYAHDIRCAMGTLPYDDSTKSTKQGSVVVLGHEYSGRDSKGRRVFGVAGSGGALATALFADKTVMWDVPDCWSLEQASTIPRVYGIAYYALIVRADLQRGESVYINAGAMSLCVACVNVAIGCGARVFVGFNNRLEHQYLNEWFPRLPEISFVDLQENTLDSALLQRTNQKGVNVIFDTLNSPKRSLFVDSLAFNGRLVEFEKSSVFDETAGYAAAEKNVTFYKISHRTLWVSDAGLNDRKRVHQLVDQGVKSGIVQPIFANVFAESDISEAFRVTQSGKYVGKVVIKIRDEESPVAAATTSTFVPETKLVRAYPSVFLNPQNSYIVTGGLTDLGIQIVDWLVSRGATKIVLLSQYRPVTGYQCLALRRWRNCGDVDVTLCNVDAASEIGARQLLENANKLAPVAGIFHAAGMESDRVFAECTPNQFQLLWKLKVDVAKHLDLASKKLCPSLKYFVGFSDTAVLYGAYGKTASAYVNAAMESVYQKRKRQNYPATVIRRGPVEKFNDTSSPPPPPTTKSNGAFAPMKNAAVFENMANLLDQSFETLSIYSVGDKDERESALTATRANELIDDIADLLEIRNAELVYYSNFRDIGMDPVVKGQIEDLLTKFGVYELSEAAVSVGQLSFAKLASLVDETN